MSIKAIRENSVLETKMRYPDGVMTRREWCNMMHLRGAKVICEKVRSNGAMKKLQQEVDRKKWSVPFGNECHPETIAYNKLKQQLKDGIYKDAYRLTLNDSSFFDITKIEYEYFMSL